MKEPVRAPQTRLHDLDALRACAMLLGIFYHVALSFALGFPWMIQDLSQAKGLFVFQAWVHGFRMQLFMLVSGFFTAMLWRQKGLKALLWHRCRRVLFPCLLGLITVVPAMISSAGFATRRNAARNQAEALIEPASSSIWAAIRKGDAVALNGHLQNPGSLTNQHPLWGTTPLTWAALTGQREVVAILLNRGARVGDRNRDGGTALHAAAFMGQAEIVELLLQKGAEVNAASASGEVPLQSAAQTFETVQSIAGFLSLPVEKASLDQGRERVVQQLRGAGAKVETPPGASHSSLLGRIAATYRWLTETPVFILVWFLWFLVWLVAIFAVYAVAMTRLGFRRVPRWLTLSPVKLLWLVPVTMIPTSLMQTDFGPDTVMGIVPVPHVLIYYALFFFFGVGYYDSMDPQDGLGRSWRWALPATILIVFPLALEFATGTFGFRDSLLPARFHKSASVLLQSAYAWAMCLTSIGLFRAWLTRESQIIRYLSDSSYWLYLAHLPLCILAQTLISSWPGSAWLKFILLSVVLTAFLLFTYEFLVRYTWVGRLLNGPRTRPKAGIPMTIRRLKGMLKRRPGDPPLAEEWAEHQREEKELEDAKGARGPGAR